MGPLHPCQPISKFCHGWKRKKKGKKNIPNLFSDKNVIFTLFLCFKTNTAFLPSHSKIVIHFSLSIVYKGIWINVGYKIFLTNVTEIKIIDLVRLIFIFVGTLFSWIVDSNQLVFPSFLSRTLNVVWNYPSNCFPSWQSLHICSTMSFIFRVVFFCRVISNNLHTPNHSRQF